MSDSESLPSDVEECATSAISTLISEKSKRAYEETCERLKKWCAEKGIKNEANEKVLLAYFEQLSKRYKCSSLWTYYSMIRSMISMKRNVDISKYLQLQAFLKRKSEGYKPKKSLILTTDNVAKFFQDADDKEWLLTKVVLIVGLAGACRKEELTNLVCDNVKNEGNVFLIAIPNTKTKISREFCLTPVNISNVNLVDIVRKYISLRPKRITHGRFFLGYRNGKCIVQPVGINTIGKMPKKIASFIKLEHEETYTGHCYRRSSASLLANSGADILTIKRHGGWRSNTVAEGYIEGSIENKKRISEKILGDEDGQVESVIGNRTNVEFDGNVSKYSETSGLQILKCENVTVNIYKN